MNLDFIKNYDHIPNYWNSDVIKFTNQSSFLSSLPDVSNLMKCFTGCFEFGNWISPIGVNINASTLLKDGS